MRHAVLNKNFSGEFPKIIRPFCRDWFVAVPDKENFSAQLTKSRRQESRDVQDEIAFLDWLAAVDLKPALFHLCPFSTEMTWVEREP